MANDEKAVGHASPNLDPDQIVTDLLGGRSETPTGVTLTGYLGPSDKAGYIRIYPDLSFSTYQEVSQEDVIGRTRSAGDADGPSQVRVAASAEILQVTVKSSEARFLSGSITSGNFVGGTYSPSGAPGGPKPQGWTDSCICPTTLPCVSLAICGAQAQSTPAANPRGWTDSCICPTSLPCVSLAICGAQAQSTPAANPRGWTDSCICPTSLPCVSLAICGAQAQSTPAANPRGWTDSCICPTSLPCVSIAIC